MYLHAHAGPSSCCILFQDRRVVTPGATVSHCTLGGTNSLNVSLPCHGGLSPRVRPGEEEAKEEEEETNVQLILLKHTLYF